MPSPLRSMTGFARARRPLGDGEVVVSVKSVNHRALDVQVHAPTAADPFENAIRTMVKQRLVRGHVEIRVALSGGSIANSVALNHDLLDGYVNAFREAAGRYELKGQPDLNIAFRLPGMFSAADTEPAQGGEAAILEALSDALDGLNAFREREGAEISTEMRKHNCEVSSVAAEMARLREGAAEQFQKRLADRLQEMLKGSQIDPQRVVQEAAILADRSDICEELARLKIHSGQLAALLDAGGETGKKLDFLLQEMNRETNTILSKTNGAGEAGLKITELGLAAKAAIEKIREQSLNLE